MPTQVQLQPGPVVDPATGKKVYYGTELIEQTTLIEESQSPTRIERDTKPPECWERKEWERLLWNINRVKVHTFEAKKKTNWAWLVGVTLIVVGAVIITGGGAAVVIIAFSETGTAAAAGVAVGAMGVGGAMAGGGGQLVKNPDDYEVGSLIGTTGPKDIKVPPPQQLPPKIEHNTIPCPEPMEPTGSTTSGPGTSTGTGSGGN